MRNLLPKLLLLAAISLPIAARADSLNFVLDGGITFSIPEPLSGAAVNQDDLRFFLLNIDFNGHPTQGQLDLFSGAIGGGFNLTYDFPGGPGHVIASGTPLFTGTTSDPTISPGSFSLIDTQNKSIDTVMITDLTDSAPTPEPSTLLLLGTGMIGLVTSIRRR